MTLYFVILEMYHPLQQFGFYTSHCRRPMSINPLKSLHSRRQHVQDLKCWLIIKGDHSLEPVSVKGTKRFRLSTRSSSTSVLLQIDHFSFSHLSPPFHTNTTSGTFNPLSLHVSSSIVNPFTHTPTPTLSYVDTQVRVCTSLCRSIRPIRFSVLLYTYIFVSVLGNTIHNYTHTHVYMFTL